VRIKPTFRWWKVGLLSVIVSAAVKYYLDDYD
jgi:hypothetical protein